MLWNASRKRAPVKCAQVDVFVPAHAADARLQPPHLVMSRDAPVLRLAPADDRSRLVPGTPDVLHIARVLLRCVPWSRLMLRRM